MKEKKKRRFYMLGQGNAEEYSEALFTIVQKIRSKLSVHELESG
jgi:hypothetical protein